MAYSRPGVYITERLLPAPVAQGPSANAAGAIAVPLQKGPEAVTYVTSWYEFVKIFGGYNAAFPATFGVAAFFANGGRELYVKRMLTSHGAIDATNASVNIVTSSSGTVATITAKNKGDDGNNLRVVVSAGTVSGTYTLSVYTEAGVAYSVNSSVSDDILVERYENIVFDDETSSDFAETVVNLISSYIQVSNSAAGTPVLSIYPLTGGVDGDAPVADDWTDYNNVSGNSVWDQFGNLDRPLVIFFPNINQFLSDGTTVDDVYSDAIAWAEVNDGFVVIETDADETVANAISFAGTGGFLSSHAAVYYPHYYISDPLGRSRSALRKIGPSGAIAGAYLRNDASIGVFKAPAGVTTLVLGAVAIEKAFTSAELDSMNASTSPVNPIRQIPGNGLAIMGARTLKQDGTANKYVNMRRSLIFIKKRLKQLTQFAIFANNDERLRTALRAVIANFLEDYRNQGGLRGATATDAFFIKCDAENNPAALIQQGEVNIEVGVALQYPAEFIVINLSQKTLD